MPIDRQARHHGPGSDLRKALQGVRAFVLDADGVLVLRGEPIAGSIEALHELEARGIPYRVVTNFSAAHRSTLAAGFARASGLDVDAARIITAASAAAAYTAARHPGEPLLVLAAPDALREWDGQQLVTPEAADRDGARVGAVVIGDAGDDLSYRNLDIAFRRLRAGAEFVAMHRNPWWLTQRGVTLDAGAAVVGLEFALGRRAVVSGKPSAVVFRQAVAELRGDVASEPAVDDRRRLRTGEVAMVGDDAQADVAAAKRVGLRGILVLSGKTTAEEIERTRVSRVNQPDAVARDLAAVVAAFPARPSVVTGTMPAKPRSQPATFGGPTARSSSTHRTSTRGPSARLPRKVS
ncbi:MAG TPA: HAD-IIA family hydrolase [Candidatus Eisenbacteria bacterium]|nr:HAD-IIA family hydrolase [Candidatus Eisenbacteria bacterium]